MKLFFKRLGWSLGLLCLLGAFTLGVLDFCFVAPISAQPHVHASTSRDLTCGVGRVEIPPPYPVVVAGYGPNRSEAQAATMPLYARALLLQSGEVTFGWVTLETVTLPETLHQALQQAVLELKLDEFWATATHTHSSMGGYDSGWVEQVVGIGKYSEDAFLALRDAGQKAIHLAHQGLTPCHLEISTSTLSQIYARTGLGVDARLHRLAFLSSEAPGKALAQVVVLAGHPTLVPRPTKLLSPDYPGHLASQEEAQGHGVTLVVQGAGGNASVTLTAPQTFADTLADTLSRGVSVSINEHAPALRVGHIEVALPKPDASRLLPKAFHTLGSNLLCASAPSHMKLGLLELFGFRLASVPFEIVFPVARQLEQEASAQRIVSLTNGYLGYMEEEKVVAEKQGESPRQYFSKDLAREVQKGFQALHQALESKPFKP